MAEETIVADELDVQDQEETEDVEIDTDVETDDEKELLKAQLAKAEADKEKWEARYKSTKKQEASKPKVEQQTKTETKEVDLDSLVERKLAAMEEQRDFIKNYGQETYDAVKAIKEKHPTLSLEDAYKISPIANDPASNSNPDTSSMWGRANVQANSKTITQEELVKLSWLAYSQMRDKIRKWEITLKQ